MENTLQVGDRIAVNKFGSYFGDIKRGEVAVFRDPAGWLGTPSESTDPKIIQSIKSGLVTVGVLPVVAASARALMVVALERDKSRISGCGESGCLRMM
jgi:signal peptidase I